MRAVIRDLKRGLRHQTRKSKKMDDELQRLKKSHSEATKEVTRLRHLHRKDFMEYSRKKADFKKDLEDLQKRASERSWTQASRIGSLEVELAAAREKIKRLEGTSAWSSAQEDYGWDWSKKFSELQKQLRDAESRHNSYQFSWCNRLDNYRRKLRASADEVLRLQKLLSEGTSVVPTSDSSELRSLRETMGKLSESLGVEKAEVQRLKIQMTCEQQAVRDAEAESEVLRKRLREAENESQRFHRMYKDMLLRKKDLEEEVENLKHALLLAESPKSEEAELPTELP